MARRSGSTKTLASIVAIIGLLMIVAGGVTWFMVQDQLSAANITVAEDADMLAGDEVNGPFSAYAEAQIIDKHALEATGGKTYAELDREDPLRETAMSASFLRASLFTSVVAFGVAAMAIGLGLTLLLIAMALMAVAKAADTTDVTTARTA
ncbi:aromatic ring-opening dioxygenase LigA [Nocardioides piscis]|uniref:Aromatic ring-opening dioxygenase LigA n=1 Tax=Nocardioides piscis TaxID=2714938 RepID=A0A6G7YIE4_9ACTN|nr:aromatic ring-opening dioxygenase LigA [Nocardioides piscis]QIK76539.1 aromatic ring-opening dioxygenase LigA [Nocardioides piscis]